MKLLLCASTSHITVERRDKQAPVRNSDVSTPQSGCDAQRLGEPEAKVLQSYKRSRGREQQQQLPLHEASIKSRGLSPRAHAVETSGKESCRHEAFLRAVNGGDWPQLLPPCTKFLLSSSDNNNKTRGAVLRPLNAACWLR